jgi:hypothetical protein
LVLAEGKDGKSETDLVGLAIYYSKYPYAIMVSKIKYDLTMKKSFDKNTYHTYISLIMLSFIAVVIGHLFWNLMLPRKDFYNELWGPAHLLVQGRSPYNTSSLDPVLPAAWLPMAIGFFFPLGWLSEKLALQVWYAFNIFEICLIVFLAQRENRNLYNTVAMALMFFFFPLTLNHFNYGQFSITVGLCWILAAYFLEKDRHWVAATCIALALSKPHLGFLALLGLTYHEYLRSGLRAIFSFWARICVMSFILCVPLFVAYPNWIPDAIVSMGKNPAWSYPSLYILFERFFGAYGHILWGCVVVIVVGANFWLWGRCSMKSAVCWSLALALLATPYVGSWDFVILFPLLIVTYINVDWKRKVFFLFSYCAAWFGMMRVQMLQVSHNHYFWWVPLWFIGTVMIMIVNCKTTLEGET